MLRWKILARHDMTCFSESSVYYRNPTNQSQRVSQIEDQKNVCAGFTVLTRRYWEATESLREKLTSGGKNFENEQDDLEDGSDDDLLDGLDVNLEPGSEDCGQEGL
jgi:hypothetical protein